MNRNELSIKFSQEKKITKMQSDEIINTVFEIIKEALKNEGKVCIKDFGTFLVKPRKGREVKAISTSELIEIPDILELKLKVSRSMKDYLNGKTD
ncbi:MAG: HU family DNA-binding protein [Clostridia bacterium]|jgi:integration host factor subunit beta|nr:HU family DNA-binding protein [Clostridia bacterium]NLV34268.1 DNA-binding protein [Clostridiaceae bacterium]